MQDFIKMMLELFCFVIASLIAFIIVKKEEDNEKN
jgi:hypothetical protein